MGTVRKNHKCVRIGLAENGGRIYSISHTNTLYTQHFDQGLSNVNCFFS